MTAVFIAGGDLIRAGLRRKWSRILTSDLRGCGGLIQRHAPDRQALQEYPRLRRLQAGHESRAALARAAALRGQHLHVPGVRHRAAALQAALASLRAKDAGW